AGDHASPPSGDETQGRAPAAPDGAGGSGTDRPHLRRHGGGPRPAPPDAARLREEAASSPSGRGQSPLRRAPVPLRSFGPDEEGFVGDQHDAPSDPALSPPMPGARGRGMTGMNEREQLQLRIGRYLEQDLSDEETLQLEALLARSESARRELLMMASLHQELF